MKNHLRLTSLSVCITLLLVTMSYCSKSKKDFAANNNKDYTELIEKSKAKQEHILEFKKKMEYYRDNPGLKSGDELLQIDATIIDWEATINFTYCHAYLELSDIVEYDIVLDIPLIKGDSITIANASDKYYNNILETIQNKFIETDYIDKKLMCVDLEPINGGDSLKINIFVGLEVSDIPPLLDWIYGEKQGECGTNAYATIYDAAIILAIDVRNHFYQEPPANCRWYFTDIIAYEDNNPTLVPNPDDQPYYYPGVITDNYKDYMIYYAHQIVAPGLSDDVRCVESLSEKGFYRQSYINITQGHIEDAPVYLEGQMKFYTCDYTGLELNFGTYYYLTHKLETRLGRRFCECTISVEDISQY